MRLSGRSGQALVELAVCLPAIVLLVVYAHAACRAAHLRSAAGSAAQSELLRAGRRLGSFGEPLRGSLVPGGRGVAVRCEQGKSSSSSIIPKILTSAMAGRSSVTVDVEKTWEEIRPSGDIPRLRLSRKSEMSIDCWDGDSQSGMKLKGTVRSIVALGFLR